MTPRRDPAAQLIACPNPACRQTLSIRTEAGGGIRRCPYCATTFRARASTRGHTDTVGSPAAGALAAGTYAARNDRPAAIGSYQITGELGRGSFGVVYQGFDGALKRDVAIKVLQRSAIGSARAVERFLREAQVVAGMHHPHIVPVYQLGEHEGGYFIAARLIRGPTLGDLIPEHGLPAARAVELILQLLDALAYAHEQGVVHRDVKPENVLLDEEGQLYLTDFGLAGFLGGAQMTQDGALLGTPAYMAPEQTRGRQSEVGASADQYGAGVVLYELLTGHHPFEGGPLSVLIHNIVHTPPPLLKELRPDLDPPLQAICLKALAKKPQDRFPDCRDMARALSDWRAGRQAPPPLELLAREAPSSGTMQPKEQGHRASGPPSSGLSQHGGAGVRRFLSPRGILFGALAAVVLPLCASLLWLAWPAKLPAPAGGEHDHVGKQEEPGPVAARHSKAPAEDRAGLEGKEKSKAQPTGKESAGDKTRKAGEEKGKMEPVRKRRPPRVFPIDEGIARMGRVNVRSYIVLDGNPPHVLALVKDAKASAPEPAKGMPGAVGAGMKGMAGPPGAARGRPGLPLHPEDLLPGQDLNAAERRRMVAVPGSELEKRSDLTPAEHPLPLRLTVIAASFPFRKQVEEHRACLALPTSEAVLAESASEKDATGKPLLSFRFLGVNAQRRELDADGKPLTDFIDCKLAEECQSCLTLTGQRSEPEDPTLAGRIFPPLVMPRPLLFRTPATAGDMSKNGYPPVEKELPLLAQATKPPDGKPEAGEASGKLPEHCLVRLIDVTVRPGKHYGYRLQVRMRNPNFGRSDVVSPADARDKELLSEWSRVPITVRIERDLHYYAVDEKALLAQRKVNEVYKGPYANDVFPRDRFVILQAHRWVGSVPRRGVSDALPVGEWLVAERFAVARGEQVGRAERVEVPYWDFLRQEHAIATDARGKKRLPGILVPFGHEAAESQPEAILVDFDSGIHCWTRASGEGEAKTITDRSAGEILLLDPDGKLILLEGARDARDEERIRRMEEVRDRLHAVRMLLQKKGPDENPFGKGP
jgi:serine/threonine protein kinase